MGKESIVILPDSTCDIPQALLERYNIQTTPQIIIRGHRKYRDRVDLQPYACYGRSQSAQINLYPHSRQQLIANMLTSRQPAAA